MVSVPIADKEQIDTMTFQIGLSIPKGILLASDRLKTSLVGYTHSRHQRKIEISPGGNLAYCSAGDTDFCAVLIDGIEKEMAYGQVRFTQGSPTEARGVLMRCATAAKERDAAFRTSRDIRESAYGNSLLVFKENNSVALWSVDTRPLIPDVSIVLDEFVVAGNANNAAVFFLNHYARQLPKTENTLISLAVHTVLMAKSDYVDGVDVGIFTTDKFRILSESDLQPYIDLSKKLDAGILGAFRERK